MMIVSRVVALFSVIALSKAAVPGHSASFLGRNVVVSDIATKQPAILDLRGGGVIDSEAYVKVTTAAYGLYALKAFLMPASMVSDHFEYPEPDGLMKFWIQGMSSFMVVMCFCFLKLPTDIAVQACLLASATTGLIFPWNAKFGYLAKDMPAKKYPMHYLPEAIFALLTIAGVMVVKDV